MAFERAYDFIIFGATGFTGQYVAKEVARISNEEHVSWAVAGRNFEKLKDILRNVETSTGKSSQEVGIIKADVGDTNSLNDMAKKGRVILNCVGPYRFFGEAVVNACVAFGASHVDISGEPQYLERMQLEYHQLARDKKVYVVGACGFDSIPADMGTVFLENKFGGEINSMETYLHIYPEGFRGNYATWQSAIYSFACAKELRPLRKQLYPERLPEMKPKLPSRGILHRSTIVKSWCLPFPGSDRSVVNRSQRYFYTANKKRPIKMLPYIQCKSFFVALVTILVGIVFRVLAAFYFGRKLLEKHPKIFSLGSFNHEGPTIEEIKRTSFIMTFVGKGWDETLNKPNYEYKTAPQKELIVRVSGPEPGYIATPICMVQAALVLLRDTEKLPERGGVYPPGAAFAKTSLIERLHKRGILFETGLKDPLKVE